MVEATTAAGSRAYRLEVISPERVMIDTQARSIQIETEDGSMGVLVNHAPLVAPVVPSVLNLVKGDGSTDSFAVGGGFLEVANNHVRLLVDSAEHPDQIDVDRAERARQRARERLAARGKGDIDFARAEVALRRAIARLKVTQKI